MGGGRYVSEGNGGVGDGNVQYGTVQCTQAGRGRSRVGKVHGMVLRGILVRVLVPSSCSLAPRERAQVANALADVPAPSVSLWLYLVPYRTWSAWIRMHNEDACQRDPCGVISTVLPFLFFSFLLFSFLLVAVVGEIRAASPSASGKGHGGAPPFSHPLAETEREGDAPVVVQSHAHLLLSSLSSPSSGPPGKRPWIDAVMRNDVGDQPPMLSANLISGWPVLWLNLLRASPH